MVKEYGYEYDAVKEEDLYQRTKGKSAQETLFGAVCLRSGRDALKAIAREYRPCTVFLPALSCDSMILPFQSFGHKICFYRYQDDYSINLDDLKQKLNQKQSLFLYMDYFGRPSLTDRELYQIKESFPNLVFIEDRTHTFLYHSVREFQPEYTVVSLRKWMAIPDGGLLWGKLTQPLSEDPSFMEQRLYAQCLRHTFLETGDLSLKDKYRSIFSVVSDLIDRDPEPAKMSLYSYELAKQWDLNDIRRIRNENAETLISILKQSSFIELIQDKAGVSDLYVAFKTNKRDFIQMTLSSMGIFNTIIWPLNPEQTKICSVAGETLDRMLAAPCDQRYTIEDMKLIGNQILKVVEDVNR